MKKFKPQDATSNLEFTQALMRIKMNPKETPATLFTQISTLQNRFGVCCECSSNRTQVVVATARRQQAGVITFDDLEDCLEDYYRQV
jgi:hypothetical protein